MKSVFKGPVNKMENADLTLIKETMTDERIL